MIEHSQTIADRALGSVLIGIERNLASLCDTKDLHSELAVELSDLGHQSARERADRLLRCATRGVDLQGWQVSLTDDLHGLDLTRGGFTVTLMFGDRLVDYVAAAARVA
jgi:hypothetical protein